MDTQPLDTAILLFAHTADEELRYKTFSESHGAEVNQSIAGTLLQHALFVAKGSGIPLVPVLSDRQVGSNFGERLANAFMDVFAAGYQRVICIGSDCPTLTPADLMQAHEALSKNRMVVGPAFDGGAYLIGLHIDSFDPENFALLNWKTDELLNELILYSYRMQACMGCVALLEEKGDVDNGADLIREMELLPVYHALHRQLLALLSMEVPTAFAAKQQPFVLPQETKQSIVLRAPPVL